MHTSWNRRVIIMRIDRISIGIHQIPATFVGPLPVYEELHVHSVPVAHRDDGRRVKTRGKTVERTHRPNRQLQLVLGRAKVVAHPSIAE